MEKFVDRKISCTYKWKNAEVKEAVLSIEQGIWCLFGNCPEMNDPYKTQFTNRRGYKYVWCLGNASECSLGAVLNNFRDIRLTRKLNHEG